MSDDLGHRRRVLYAVLSICLSFFLQAVGFATPGWLYAVGDIGEYHIELYVGLWYRIVCDANDTCVTEAMPILGRENDRTDIENVLEYQIETCLALVFCISAFISGLVYRQFWKRNVPSLLVVCVFSVGLSGVLALIAAGKEGHEAVEQYKKEKELGVVILKFPFSLFITGVGGLVACIVSILLIIEFHIFTRNAGLSRKAADSSMKMTGNINMGYQEPWPSSTSSMDSAVTGQSISSPHTSMNASPYAVGGVVNPSGRVIKSDYIAAKLHTNKNVI